MEGVHWVDARQTAAHRAELPAEPVDEDLGPVARLFGGLLERVELGLLQLRGDVGERARRNPYAALEETAHSGRDALDDVDLACAHLELLRDAVARPPPVVRQLDDDLLAADDRRLDRVRRDAAAAQERADGSALPAEQP